jgi:hypothetical protein
MNYSVDFNVSTFPSPLFLARLTVVVGKAGTFKARNTELHHLCKLFAHILLQEGMVSFVN